MSTRDRVGTVVVVGSINLDRTSYVTRMPRPGETVLASMSREGLGGKGANQAVAAARLGASVTMVGSVGDDTSGRFARRFLADCGIDVRHVSGSSALTGAAHIVVDAEGQNAIVVSSGANAELTPGSLTTAADALSHASVVLSQGELPPETIDEIPRSLASHGTDRSGPRFILNLAPTLDVNDRTLNAADPLVVNETEAEALLGSRSLVASRPDHRVEAAIEAATAMTRTRATTTVITMGELGAVAAEPSRAWHQPATRTAAVRDTTGAGDAFAGTLAVFLAEGFALTEAVRASVCAGTLATTRRGAAESYANRAELEQALPGVPKQGKRPEGVHDE